MTDGRSINKVILIGNLGSDPEIRGTQTGEIVVSFSLATSESWRDREGGERRERTEWHHIAIFNKQIAKVAKLYLRKGSTEATLLCSTAGETISNALASACSAVRTDG